MKLRNKKTGEIGYPYFQNWKEITCVIVDENAIQLAEYTSLAELEREWEDYEEPKEYYCITGRGNLHFIEDIDDESDKERKQIGNYFETKEEAEKAVEKLKAWKRLKDNGFRFGGWSHTPITYSTIGYNLHIKAYTDELANYMKDLDLLFGGEE